MRPARLVGRGLAFHARAHAATLGGVAVASAVLTGALALGDSVRASRARAAAERLGRIDAVLQSGERTFGAGLAARLMARVPELELTPALELACSAASADGARRAADVGLLGVEPGFFALGPRGSAAAPAENEAWAGVELARELGLAPGDELVLRVERPSALTRELAFASAEETIQPLRVTITRIVSGEEFGLFALAAGAGPRANLFLARESLARASGNPGRANRLFAHAGAHAGELASALREVWELDDVGLELVERDGVLALTSAQVFLGDSLIAAVRAARLPALGLLTYFVNELGHGARATPYSTVAALGGAGLDADLGAWRAALPLDLGRDGIVLNAWEAQDLAAAAGDEVTLRYYVLGAGRALEEKSASFQVRAIVPAEGLGADPTLTPNFPGIGDAKNCRDWQPGLPLDLGRIRDEDEAYWHAHRGAPKAFIGAERAQELWTNRFGALTALRVPAGSRAELLASLHTVAPGELGLALVPVDAAVEAASDFGGLFLGLSFFLIVSALLLAALFCALALERRASELGVLRVCGFAAGNVARLQLGEALVVCAAGAGLGALAGLGYTRLLLFGLERWWRAAVGRTELVFHVQPATWIGAALASLGLGLAATAWVLRRALRARPLGLLWGELAPEVVRASRSRARRVWLGLCVLLTLACCAAALRARGEAAAGLCFGAGLACLCGGLAFLRARLEPRPWRARSALGLGWSNAARRPGQSLALAALVASAVFLLVVAGANRQGPTPRDAGPDSGTGGFAFLGRTTLPVLQDLNAPAGREFYGLAPADLEGVALVALRVRAGDEASCLNLDRPKSPRLLGVPAARLAGRFRFAATARETSDPWSLLEEDLGPDVVPAIVDATSLQWTLHGELGGELALLDGRGLPFRARVVGTLADSILQGDVLIGERAFEARFPDEAGHRAFLIDAPPARAEALGAELTRRIRDEGLVLVPAAERLDLLHGVQNTYLVLFQVLGALGLVLGSVGLFALVLRSALERRGELALLRVLGFSRSELRWLFLGEQGLLAWAGLALGVLAGACAVLPSALAQGAAALEVLPNLLATIALVGVLGSVWVWLGTFPALRGAELAELRRE